MHIHLSGIDYGPKGEKKHIPLATADLRYRELMQAMKQAGVRGTLVVEAPREVLLEDVDRIREAWEAA
jgi:deoxyribonuclease-4